MSHQADINRLKATMQQSTEFHVVWDAFFDLAEKPKFMAMSRQVRLDRLEIVLGEICKQLVRGAAGKLESLITLRYANSHFHHGFLAVAGLSGSFMYFKDSDAGMAALSSDPNRSWLFCRFTLSETNSQYSYLAPLAHPARPLLH